MTTIIDWPLSVLAPADTVIVPEYATRPDQQATNGMRRSPGVTSSALRLKLIGIPVHTEARFRTLQAMLGLMEGNSTLVRLRLPELFGIDGDYTTLGKARRALYPNGVPFAADVLFSGGTGFAPSYRNGTLSAAAALGDRTIYIADDEELPGGTYISIDDFVYTMTGVWMDEAGINRVTISPTLRKAAALGTEVEYAPVFVGTCVTANPGSEERKWGRFGLYTFEFLEDLTRLVDLS